MEATLRRRMKSLPMHQAVWVEGLVRSGAVDVALHDEIVKHMAREIVDDVWRTKRDAGARVGDEPPKSVPSAARQNARDLISGIEKLNHMPIEAIWVLLRGAPGEHEQEPTLDWFAYYAISEAQQAGTSWYESHPDTDPMIDFPHMEVWDGVF